MSTARSFASLHDRAHPLVLPNAWDAISARIFEAEGFPAIATTSAGVAFALGYRDGEKADVDEMIGAIRRIARVVRVPLTADFEAGYANDIETLVASVERVVEAGAVGINLEDWNARAGALFPLDEATARIRALKERFADTLFVNARTDTYLRDAFADEYLLEETLLRLHAFVAAGADGVFVPGVADAETIGKLAAGVTAPLNVLAGPQTPRVAELQKLGVARVSTGSGPMRRVMGVTRDIARELRERGTFSFTREPGVEYPEANRLLAPAP